MKMHHLSYSVFLRAVIVVFSFCYFDAAAVVHFDEVSFLRGFDLDLA